MPRRLSQRFVSRPLAELTRQLLFSPPEKRVEQVQRAEHLHDQINFQVNYPLDFVNYRITGYRSESRGTTILPGEVIRPDLRLMIDMLSRSVGMPIGEDEPVETPEQVAARLKVSTKTITRWRKAGLRWRWAMAPDTKRKQIVITCRGLEHFLSQNEQQVARASRFTHLEPELRHRVLKRARRIAEAREVSPHLVAQHLARRVGRATQTIRSILEQHDRENPHCKIFVNRTEPLTAQQKRVICRAHRMAVTTSKICRRFKRTRSTVLRVVRERRAAAFRRLNIRYVDSPMFARDDADEVILSPERIASSRDESQKSMVSVADLPEVLHPLYYRPVTDAQTMRSHMFRLNYLKYKAATGRDQLDKYEPRVADLDRIEGHLKQASALRNQLVAANSPVVLSVARRHLIDLPDHSATASYLIELLEMSVPILIDSIDTFDPARKQTFEWYLTWHLMRHFAKQSQAMTGSATHGRAHRREAPEKVLQRMRQVAAGLGVNLGIGVDGA